jgi:hypothetical protein
MASCFVSNIVVLKVVFIRFVKLDDIVDVEMIGGVNVSPNTQPGWLHAPVRGL